MKKLILFIIPFLIFGCSSVYEEKNEEVFEDLRWYEKEKIIFTPILIDDIESKYDIELTLSHFYPIDLGSFPIQLKIENPSKTDTIINYQIESKDSKGEMLTNCSGDYCDLTQKILQDYNFKEKGEYKITVSQPNKVVQGITSLRVSVLKK